MSYGQLIWDVPKIENIKKNDEIERKEKVVDKFLSAVILPPVSYNKIKSCVSYNGKSFWIFGYNIENDTPFFNNCEAIKNAAEEIKKGKEPSEPIYFVMASDTGDWDTYKYTRKIDGKFYYLFRLTSSIDISRPKINWSTLKCSCSKIAQQKSNEKLFE